MTSIILYLHLQGISVTNTSPLVVPTRAQQVNSTIVDTGWCCTQVSWLLQCVLGTNPISFAAPSTTDPFVLDMATSTAAIGKVH